MSGNLMPTRHATVTQANGLVLDRRGSRELAAITQDTLVQLGFVQREARIVAEQGHVLDEIASSFGYGDAMLHRSADIIARGDPVFRNRLDAYLDISHIAKCELLSNTGRKFSRDNSLR